MAWIVSSLALFVTALLDSLAIASRVTLVIDGMRESLIAAAIVDNSALRTLDLRQTLRSTPHLRRTSSA